MFGLKTKTIKALMLISLVLEILILEMRLQTSLMIKLPYPIKKMESGNFIVMIVLQTQGDTG